MSPKKEEGPAAMRDPQNYVPTAAPGTGYTPEPTSVEILVPLELERELLAGLFRATAILEDASHEAAEEALSLAVDLDPDDFGMTAHREIARAIQTAIATDGTASPALVVGELRRRRQFEALRLLPHLVTYSWCPVRSITGHVDKVRSAARARRRFRRAQSVQARVLEGATS